MVGVNFCFKILEEEKNNKIPQQWVPNHPDMWRKPG